MAQTYSDLDNFLGHRYETGALLKSLNFTFFWILVRFVARPTFEESLLSLTFSAGTNSQIGGRVFLSLDIIMK